jgi:hypothetical protein
VERLNYVEGIIDGFLYSPMFGGSEQSMHALKICVGGMQSGQALAIVDQYMKGNPSQWDWQMNLLVHRALYAACKEPSAPLQ